MYEYESSRLDPYFGYLLAYLLSCWLRSVELKKSIMDARAGVAKKTNQPEREFDTKALPDGQTIRLLFQVAVEKGPKAMTVDQQAVLFWFINRCAACVSEKNYKGLVSMDDIFDKLTDSNVSFAVSVVVHHFTKWGGPGPPPAAAPAPPADDATTTSDTNTNTGDGSNTNTNSGKENDNTGKGKKKAGRKKKMVRPALPVRPVPKVGSVRAPVVDKEVASHCSILSMGIFSKQSGEKGKTVLLMSWWMLYMLF